MVMPIHHSTFDLKSYWENSDASHSARESKPPAESMS